MSTDSSTDQISYYFIRLLYDKKPVLSRNALLAQLQSVDKQIEPLGDDKVLMYINRSHRITNVANNPSAPVAVTLAERINQKELELAIGQTWDWPDAESTVQKCSHALLINDMRGHLLERNERLMNLQKTLFAVLNLWAPKAIHWPASQKIVDPKTVIASLRDGEFDSLDNGAVNVRLFNVGNHPGEHVMDTLGLAFFDLPDLQCHFSNLDPGHVAGSLFSYATYLFENGPVIESGNTVDGCNGKQWKCNLEWSLVEPRRHVIDLDAGR